MHKIIRTLGVLLASMALFLAPGVALADSHDARIVDQDKELRGLAMHYHPVASEDMRQGYTHRSYNTRPSLFTVELPEGNPYLAYCIEITVDAHRKRTTEITQWDGFLGKNAFRFDPHVRTKIAWIVHYSYPSRSLEDFAHDVGVPNLTVAQAVTGTQSAIWRLTDGVEPDFVALAKKNEHSVDAQAIKAVYDYLLSERNIGLEQKELNAHIALTVPEDPGFAGEVYGPITIDSDQEFVSLQTRDDILLVDRHGQRLSRERLPRDVGVFLDLRNKEMAGEVELTAAIEDTAFHGWLINTVLPANKHAQTLVMVRKFSQRRAEKVKISWRGADDVCRDASGKAVRDPQSGKILGQDSPLCLPPAPEPVPPVSEPVPPVSEPVPPVSEPVPPVSEPVPPVSEPVVSVPAPAPVVSAPTVTQPELANTGSGIMMISLLALVMLGTGGYFIIAREV